MIEKEKIEAAIKLFLEGIGEDPNRIGLLDTPHRISNMCLELFSATNPKNNIEKIKTFEAPNNNMVLQKNINFYSLCEHHLLPFFGYAHIAYIPNGKVLGLSKLARCVDISSKKLQLQENLTNEIAQKIISYVNPKGVIVMLEAEHLCMTMRGIKKPGTKTITYVTKGIFSTDKNLTDNFFNLIKFGA